VRTLKQIYHDIDNEDSKMSLIFSKDQNKAVDMLKDFLKSDESFATILGSAGVGKTTMVSAMPELYDAAKVLATGPTNKCVRVLRDKIPAEIECITINKFLGLGVKNVKDKKVSYRVGTYDPTEWAHIKVVLVDESSMLGSGLRDEKGKLLFKGLCDFIKEDAEEFDRKYIIMGDDCQLPPVEGSQKQTEAFGLAAPDNSVTMTEIVRQAADNPIIMAATLVRDAIKTKQEPKLRGGLNELEGTGVELLKRMAWVERLEEYVGDPRIHTDVDFCRVIAWTNDAVKEHNLSIRGVLGADITRPFDLGDTVVVNEAVEKGFTVVLGTGQEVIVETMRESEHPVKGFKEWVVTLQALDLSEPLRVLDESSRPAYLAELERLRKQCSLSKQWQPFYGLKNYYADLRPPYSITAHKSQGSTFENVFVDLKDIYSNRNQGEADKCYYVAITRASRKVFVLV